MTYRGGLSHNTFALAEANFFKNSGNAVSTDVDPSEAYAIYNSSRTRMKSRFMRKGGIIPGMLSLYHPGVTRGHILRGWPRKAQEVVDNQL